MESPISLGHKLLLLALIGSQNGHLSHSNRKAPILLIFDCIVYKKGQSRKTLEWLLGGPPLTGGAG